MKPFDRGIILLGVVLGLLFTACSPIAAANETDINFHSQTPMKIGEAAITSLNEPNSTPIPLTSTPHEASPSYTAIPSQTLHNTPGPTMSPAATPCPPGLCIYPGQFFLERPIPEDENNEVDVTYRYGSTQGDSRDPHHGVEFLNGYGTTILAAGDGIVVVAGDDIDPISEQGEWPIEYYGPYSNFYGNLVVLEHQVPEELRTLIPAYAPVIYTLYGHLSEILVDEGEQVQSGQKIGEVGVAGVSIGSHLHFEVREGENKYANSRNPELWLAPKRGEGGMQNGGLAARVIDPNGNNVAVSNIVLEYLPKGAEELEEFEIYLLSYEEKDLIDQAPFRESFAVGDVPPGLYRISFPYYGRQEFMTEVYPGQLTVITFKVE